MIEAVALAGLLMSMDVRPMRLRRIQPPSEAHNSNFEPSVSISRYGAVTYHIDRGYPSRRQSQFLDSGLRVSYIRTGLPFMVSPVIFVITFLVTDAPARSHEVPRTELWETSSHAT
jgi:hypothetical protein